MLTENTKTLARIATQQTLKKKPLKLLRNKSRLPKPIASFKLAKLHSIMIRTEKYMHMN